MVKKRTSRVLPIFNMKDRLLRAVNSSKVTVVVGETGSGKTTQLAQYLYEHKMNGHRKIGVTQPRRVAAIAVAKRVAAETGGEVGGLVGYNVRFSNKTGSSTKIKYMTEGMMLREALIDPSLEEYSVIIIDEAHERSVNTDILLGLLKRILCHREDLKVVVMSASIEANVFVEYFSAGEFVEIKGRNYEVELLHTVQPELDYLDACVVAIIQVHLDYPVGDILVFMTGQEEIQDAQEILMKKRELLPCSAMDFLVVPMFAALPPTAQLKVFNFPPGNTRKIILATNIAETSITIPGIRYVIDSGVVKERTYDPHTGMEALKVVKISKAAALQRAGRAGRLQNGKCFRLYTRNDFQALSEYSKPEITRSNLANALLQLKTIGEDPRVFPYLDRPEDLYIEKAIKQLKGLGALDMNENISNVGKRMAELPLPPVLARILLAALEPEFNCVKSVLTLVALLSVENLCYASKRQEGAKFIFQCEEGDHLTLITVFNEWKKNRGKHWCNAHGVNRMAFKRAKMIRSQLKGYLKKYTPVYCRADNEQILRCLARGCYMNSAVLQPDNIHYRTLKDGEFVFIHPTSVLFHRKNKPRCIVFNEVVVTSKKYVRQVSEVDLTYIQNLMGR